MTAGQFEFPKPHRPRVPRRAVVGTRSRQTPLPEVAKAVQAERLTTWPFLLVSTFWVLVLFEVDVFLTAKTGVPFYRLPLLLVPLVCWACFQRWNTRAVYWPLLVFTLLHLGASLFASNAGFSRGSFKYMVYVMLFFAISVLYADSPAKVIVLLRILLLSYIWFGVQGLVGNGRVSWHPLMSNEDSYGPLMVLLLPFSYFFSLATTSSRWRWIARGAFVIALAGIVISFARGAALAAGLVLLYLILRSPRRIRLLGLLAVGVVIALPIISSVFPIGSWIAEIASSGQGDSTRTGLWMAAVRVFETSPLFGVGAGNFGVVADQIAHDQVASLGLPGVYMIAVHNPHFQILAEEGLIGITAWFMMLVAIVRWNRFLRTPGAQLAWDARGGQGLRLRILSFGLEGLLVAYLGTSIFYNQLYIHWIWSLLTISYLLAIQAGSIHKVVRSPRRRASAPASSGVGHSNPDQVRRNDRRKTGLDVPARTVFGVAGPGAARARGGGGVAPFLHPPANRYRAPARAI